MIVAFSYHSDDVAILVLWSHVLYLDNTKRQTTFNLQQLRPLSLKSDALPSDAYHGRMTPWQGGEPQSYLRLGSKLFLSLSPTRSFSMLIWRNSTPANILHEAVEQVAA